MVVCCQNKNWCVVYRQLEDFLNSKCPYNRSIALILYNYLNLRDIVYFVEPTPTHRWPSAAADWEMWTAHYSLCFHQQEQNYINNKL